MTIKTSNFQTGLSVTPANNFTLTAEADNGTMKLARGNAGATTQDILTVKTDHTVDFTVGIFGFAYGTNANGSYLKFPSWIGGVIIQWGATVIVGGGVTQTWPLAFPTACQAAVCCPAGAANLSVVAVGFSALGVTTGVMYANSGAPGVTWIAIGK